VRGPGGTHQPCGCEGLAGADTVMRGQSFAGHALADVSGAGASAAFLLGINPLLGFLVMGALAAGGMEAAGVRRQHGHDLATGVVFGAGLGLAALLVRKMCTNRSCGVPHRPPDQAFAPFGLGFAPRGA